MISVPLISLIAVWSCFATPTLILLMLIAAYAAYIVYVRNQYASIVNPPFTNFFVGNGSELMLAKRNRHLLWITWDRAYGPIFKLCVFHKVVIMTTSAELARKLCLDANYPKARISYGPLRSLMGEPFMGRGLVTETDHSAWRIHRSIFNPAFYKRYLRRFIHVFDDNALKLVQTLESVSKEGTVSISLLDYLGCVLMDVICEAGFSFRPNCLENKDRPFPRAMYSVLRAISESLADPFYHWKPWNRAKVRSHKEAARFIRQTGYDIIRGRIHETPSNRDILDMVIQNMQESGDKISEEVLVDDFVTFFVAGQETTSNSIAFLFYLLSNHTDCKRRCQEEADTFFEEAQDSISFESLDDLRYIEACWKEALRLYPPAFATVREIPKGREQLGDYWLPAGTDVAINFLAINYNSCPDGARFNPDRIYEGRETTTTSYPFSLGQRACIGRHFAEIEAKILIVRLLRHFDFQMMLDQSFDVDEALTLRLYDGCMLRLTARNQ